MTYVSIIINAPIETVWENIADIKSHVQWMDDAESIIELGEKQNCVGAKYLCVTKVGPLKTNDVMEVTQYEQPTTIEIHHVGAVKGKGWFELKVISESTTEFIWREDLTFPIHMGAGLGKIVAMQLLHRIWKKNLENLKKSIEK